MTTVEILLYGLIAFVLDHPTNPEKVTALIVDGREHSRSTDLCSIHGHVPFVVFLPAERQTCDVAPCMERKLGEVAYCWCRLDRHEIVISPLPKAQSEVLPVRPAHPLPRDRREARDFAWVPRLRNVHSTGQAKDAAPASVHVAGRLPLNWTAVQTCHLATYEDYIYSFKFWPLTSSEPVSISAQALAESVKFSYQTQESVVSVGFRRFGFPDLLGPLKVRCPSGKCEIFVGNTPTCEDVAADQLAQGFCGPGSLGRDFERYYALSEREPGFRKAPVPHRIPGSSVNSMLQPACGGECPWPLLPLGAAELCQQLCSPALVTGRAVCPMAVLEE